LLAAAVVVDMGKMMLVLVEAVLAGSVLLLDSL
jgi:hypothetical protein